MYCNFNQLPIGNELFYEIDGFTSWKSDGRLQAARFELPVILLWGELVEFSSFASSLEILLLSMPFFIVSISFTVIFAKKDTLCKVCQNTGFLWHIISRMKKRRTYHVLIRENKGQRKPCVGILSSPYKEEKNISCSYKGKHRAEKTVLWHTFLQRFFGGIQEIFVITLRKQILLMVNSWWNCLIFLTLPVSKLFGNGLITEIYPLNTGRKVNVHKTFRTSRTFSEPLNVRSIYVLCPEGYI